MSPITSVREAILYLQKFKEKEEREKKDKEILEQLADIQDILNKKNDKRITLNRQLLILHYTGLLDSLEFQTHEKMYSFYQFVINRNKQTIKEFFIDRAKSRNSQEYKRIFNENDLEFISQLFEEIGLTEPLQKVNSDILNI